MVYNLAKKYYISTLRMQERCFMSLIIQIFLHLRAHTLQGQFVKLKRYLFSNWHVQALGMSNEMCMMVLLYSYSLMKWLLKVGKKYGACTFRIQERAFQIVVKYVFHAGLSITNYKAGPYPASRWHRIQGSVMKTIQDSCNNYTMFLSYLNRIENVGLKYPICALKMKERAFNKVNCPDDRILLKLDPPFKIPDPPLERVNKNDTHIGVGHDKIFDVRGGSSFFNTFNRSISTQLTSLLYFKWFKHSQVKHRFFV